MVKKIILFIAALCLLFSIKNASAATPLICTVQAGGCDPGDTLLLLLSDLTNAHAALPGSGSSFPYSVCCSKSSSSLSSVCGSVEGDDFDYISFLSSLDNAHVQWANTYADAIPPYQNNPACIAAGQGQQVQCEYTTTCSPQFACIMTISAADNAHVASCSGSPYPNKICCRVLDDTIPPTISYVYPTAENNSRSADPKGSTNYVNWIYINVTASENLASACTMRIVGGSFTQDTVRTMGWDGKRNCWINETNNVLGLDDAQYRIYVNATDFASNQGSTDLTEGDRVIWVTTDLPRSVILKPIEGGIYNQTTWQQTLIKGYATDEQNGIQFVVITIQNKSTGWYWNGAGFQSDIKWLLTTQTGGDSSAYNWSYFLFPEQNGQFIIHSNASDFDGFKEDPPLPIINFNMDLRAPHASITSFKYNGGNAGSPVSYAGTAVDFIRNGYASLVAKVQYKVWDNETGAIYTDWTEVPSYTNGPPPQMSQDFAFDAVLVPGYNKVEVRAVDVSGNIDLAPDFDTVVYVTDYPSVSIQAPHPSRSPYTAEKWSTENPIRGKASDSNGDVVSVKIFVQRVSDSLYWNGAAWQSDVFWIPVTGKGSPPEVYDPWEWPDSGFYLPEVGKYKIRANATDNSQKISIYEVEVIYDPILPSPWIDPLPKWTKNNSIMISWNGSDQGSGIVSFNVEWNNQTGVPGEQWYPLLPPTPLPGTAALVPVFNNVTYFFRVNATDAAGNIKTSVVLNVTVDLQPPVCIMADLPQYGTSPLFFNWTTTENESGIAFLGVWVMQKGFEFHVNPSPDCQDITPSSTSTRCNLLEAVAYLKCGAIDAAGNVGANSTKNITIDKTPPTGELVKPKGKWTNRKPFMMEWAYIDPISSGISSGLNHYNIHWSNISSTGPWIDLVNSGNPNITFTQLLFGSGVYNDDTVIHEGEIFWFEVRSRDNAGVNSSWNLSNTTIDTQPPTATLNVTDQNGNVVNPPDLTGIETINISSNASDFIPPSGIYSDIGSHTIWVQKTQEGVILKSYSCGPSPFCTTGNISITQADEIVYWVEVQDNAGNRFLSPSYTLSQHRLANFVNHDITLITGSEFVLDVQVRNLQTVPLSYTELNISGYPSAGFTGADGDFISKVSADGRSMALTDFSPGGRGVAHIRLIASEPGTESTLSLVAAGHDATGTISITDTDSAHITVVFPASFSAWSDWAVILLLFCVIVSYYLLAK